MSLLVSPVQNFQPVFVSPVETAGSVAFSAETAGSVASSGNFGSSFSGGCSSGGSSFSTVG